MNTKSLRSTRAWHAHYTKLADRVVKLDAALNEQLSKLHPAILLCAVAALSLLLQYLRVRRIGFGADGGYDIDPRLYSGYAERWLAGQVPFRDFVVEYPPASLYIFTIPALAFANVDYRIGFGLMMVIMSTALALLTWTLSRRLWPRSILYSVLAQIILYSSFYYLSHLTYRRYDLAPTLLVLAALCTGGPWGALILGFAVAVKLWPLVLLPLVLSKTYCDAIGDKRRALLISAAFFVAGLILPIVPFWLSSGSSIFNFLAFHHHRGIQIESVWAIIPYIADALGVLHVRMVYNFGADHLAPSALTLILAQVSTLALALLTAWPWFNWLRARQWRLELPQFVRLITATIIGFMLGSKVFSPQYVIWLLPLAVIASLSLHAPKKCIALASSFAIPLLTKQIFPRHFPELRDGPRGQALIIVLIRFACLVTLYVFFSRAQSQEAEPKLAHASH